MAKILEDRGNGLKLGTLNVAKDGAIKAERIPITQHVADYVQGLQATGRVPDHITNVKWRLQWFVEETGITRLSQLRPHIVEIALKTLRHGSIEHVFGY
jgi:hypothetical protein